MNQTELHEKNRLLEMQMVESAEDKLKQALADPSEHGLKFGVFIKSVFDDVYKYVTDNKPPFDKVYYQQSAYTIAATLIHCLHAETSLRNIVAHDDTGLKHTLNWDIRLPQEELTQYRQSLIDGLTRYHRRVFNFIGNIIDHFDTLKMFKNTPIYRPAEESRIGSQHVKHLEAMSIQLLNTANSDQVVADDMKEYVLEVQRLLTIYLKHIKLTHDDYTIMVSRVKGSRPDVGSDLLASGTFDGLVNDIFRSYEFYSSGNIDDAIQDEWLTKYVMKIINNLSVLVCENGDTYGEVGFVVRASDAVNEDLLRMVSEKSIAHPRSLPIIVKPKDWVIGDTEGGFHYIASPLLPSRKERHELPSKLYLEGVNRIQATGFTVNRKLLAMADLIGYEEYINPVKERSWSKERYRRDCESKKSKNRDLHRIVQIAHDYTDYDDYWFTNYADFRGRVYYRQEYFSPQGQDMSKALQYFNAGHIVDKKALRWIRINIANLWGKDDVSYYRRVEWVKKNLPSIRLMVEAPLADPKLMPDGTTYYPNLKIFYAADKSWQFLAACIDYLEYLENPKTHKSCLPVGMDGKCNGTQHWCAMLRDGVGGAKVALTDSDKPSDLYTDVLNSLMGSISIITKKKPKGVDGSTELNKAIDKYGYAIAWKKTNKIDRKFVKTPTMTTTYAAGKKAFRGHVDNFCIDKDIIFSEDKAIQKRHINFIVDMIIRAIDATVSVKGGMRFVQGVVDGVDEVHFTTPLDFHVYMNPKRKFKREFSVMVDNRKRNITFSYEGKHADNLAIHTGIAPNYVHSMDATHMMMVVLDCPQITHWMMIHDQFSCHACFVEDMQKSIRKTFVELYEDDQLELFRKQFVTVKPSVVEVKMPEKGDLILTDVLQSKYFFS